MTISTTEEKSGLKVPFSYLLLLHPPYQAPDLKTVVPYWCVIDSFTLSCKNARILQKVTSFRSWKTTQFSGDILSPKCLHEC